MVAPGNLVKQKYSRRWAWFVVAILGAVVGGVLIASRFSQDQVPDGTQYFETSGKQQIISDIKIGALISHTEAQDLNPRIEQKSRYTTIDPLVMRITSTEQATEPFSVNVRLVRPDGSIVGIDPPTATFSPGISSFCCWTVSEPGEYTLQIYRPEGIFSSAPLTIVPALNSDIDASKGKGFLFFN